MERVLDDRLGPQAEPAFVDHVIGELGHFLRESGEQQGCHPTEARRERGALALGGGWREAFASEDPSVGCRRPKNGLKGTPKRGSLANVA